MRAKWNGQVIAESPDTIVVENNHYFPPNSVKKEFLSESDMHTTCPWKGLAHYYNVIVKGDEATDAAFYYPEPKEAAEKLGIKDYVAFWRGVEVSE